MADLSDFEDSRPYRVKKSLDRFLPVIIALLVVYLYIEFLAPPEFWVYSYRVQLQYFLLFYFILELAVLFSMYESNREFVRAHWLDLILTVPFVTAFKGLAGLKMLKSLKPVKALKSSKLLKAAKISQKSGKFMKKLRKQYLKKKN